MKTSPILAWLRESADLFATFDPKSAGFKVVGVPNHAGGPRTKHQQLMARAARRGEPYSKLICLSAVRAPIPLLRLLRARGARIHVNQNGVYYPLWCPEGFRARNRFLRRLNEIAHHSYFQSEFSETSYLDWVGPLPASRSVLYNPVDREKFTPNLSRASDPRHLRGTVFLDFRHPYGELWDHLMPMLARGDLNCSWTFLGRADEAELVTRLQAALPKAEWHFDPEQATVARLLREQDFAIHVVYNDVCPNKVLECLASGVYVIGTSAGGTGELLAKGGGETLTVPGGYDRRSYPSTQELAAAIKRFGANPDAFRAQASQAAERYDLARWIKAITAEE